MQDIDQAIKDKKTKETHLEQLKHELEVVRKENEGLGKKVDELENHREYLIDKVTNHSLCI